MCGGDCVDCFDGCGGADDANCLSKTFSLPCTNVALFATPLVAVLGGLLLVDGALPELGPAEDSSKGLLLFLESSSVDALRFLVLLTSLEVEGLVVYGVAISYDKKHPTRNTPLYRNLEEHSTL